jgi:deoxyribose-phosphate aldolase
VKREDGMGIDPAGLASTIDQAVLDPTAGPAEVRAAAEEAVRRGFAAVFVLPHRLPLLAELLGTAGPAAGTVAGFPLGGEPPEAKAAGVAWAVAHGAREVDLVVNLSALRAGEDEALRQEAAAVREAAAGRTVKWILETGLLTPRERDRAVDLLVPFRPAFLKTSTGFLGPGATVEAVAALRRRLPRGIAVKASGGIRTLDQARELLEAGAERLGTSAGPDLHRQALEAAS